MNYLVLKLSEKFWHLALETAIVAGASVAAVKIVERIDSIFDTEEDEEEGATHVMMAQAAPPQSSGIHIEINVNSNNGDPVPQTVNIVGEEDYDDSEYGKEDED